MWTLQTLHWDIDRSSDSTPGMKSGTQIFSLLQQSEFVVDEFSMQANNVPSFERMCESNIQTMVPTSPTNPITMKTKSFLEQQYSA